MLCHHLPHRTGHEGGDSLDIGGQFRPKQHFNDLVGHHAAKLGPAGCADMGGAINIQPLARALIHQAGADGIESAGQALGRHHDVGLDAIGLPAPHGARAHQSGLHFIGDIHGAMLAGQLPAGIEIAFLWHGKAISCRDGFHDQARNIIALECIFHRVNVVEGNLDEGFRLVTQEYLAEAFVAGWIMKCM